MVIEAPGELPLLLDLGTGLRAYGRELHSAPFHGVCLLTHLHWDHIQGLPFFSALLADGGELDLYGPAQSDEYTVAEAIGGIVCPPAFPVTMADFPGTLRCHDVPVGYQPPAFRVGGYHVTAREVPHLGRTLGYRITGHGRVITYIPDHQQPVDGSFEIDPAVLELAEGADLLIHDAQFTPEEFTRKTHWGHSTAHYALHVAASAGADTLALFHHDPSHDDEMIDVQHDEFVAAGQFRGVQVVTAREGMCHRLDAAR